MKILVTGTHRGHDPAVVRAIHEQETVAIDGILTLIHGAAPGVDTQAAELCLSRGWKVVGYPAEWDKHGKAAGPIRNGRMLRAEHLDATEPIDLVLAFPAPDSRGTWDCIQRAAGMGIEVRIYPVSSPAPPETV